MLFKGRSDKWFNQGMEFLNKEQYPEAIKAFSQDIQTNGVKPETLGALMNRGFAYFCLAYETTRSIPVGYSAEADELLENAIKDYSEVIDVMTFRVKRSAESINAWADVYYKRANANLFLRKFQEAIHDYKEAINLQSRNSEYYIRLGLVYSEYIGDASTALEIYSKAVSTQPSAEAYLYRAWANHDLGNIQAAKNDFKSSTTLNPNVGNVFRKTPIIVNPAIAFERYANWEEFKQSI